MIPLCRKYEGFGGPADISVCGLQNLIEENEALERQRNAYRSELANEKREQREVLALIHDFLPEVETWEQLISTIETLQMRVEQLETFRKAA